MKRLKLKKWVKVVLVGVVVAGIIAFANDYTNKSINECVEAGHSVNFCEKHLG